MIEKYNQILKFGNGEENRWNNFNFEGIGLMKKDSR